ncbi:MAG TPA: hypothetical protein VFW38_00155, partial [Solirubrobacteraceae bacterium]|nr:hypothetical protein [Solirubrobacteraceae bacterium]
SPDPDAVRAIFDRAIDHGEALGLEEHRDERGRVRFAFPVAVLSATRRVEKRQSTWQAERHL